MKGFWIGVEHAMATAPERWPKFVFRTPTRSGWHRHHLLPNHLRRYPDLRDFMLGIAGSGVALDDFSTNGMFLPAEEELARVTQLPLHRGSHRTYNGIVIEALEAIRRTAISEKIGVAGRVTAVRSLQRQLKTLLRTSASDTQVSLASCNPFGQTPVGEMLDRQTDALWAEVLAREVC
jgi:A nuclease family of the HNH/ENDO VII superfamily with conserved AHH